MMLVYAALILIPVAVASAVLLHGESEDVLSLPTAAVRDMWMLSLGVILGLYVAGFAPVWAAAALFGVMVAVGVVSTAALEARGIDMEVSGDA